MAILAGDEQLRALALGPSQLPKPYILRKDENSVEVSKGRSLLFRSQRVKSQGSRIVRSRQAYFMSRVTPKPDA
jgi:hypothetical protein